MPRYHIGMIFAFLAAVVGWVFAFDSEARYQCAKDANSILTAMLYIPEAPVVFSETPDGLSVEFGLPNGEVYTLVYPARCKDLNKP